MRVDLEPGGDVVASRPELLELCAAAAKVPGISLGLLARELGTARLNAAREYAPAARRAP